MELCAKNTQIIRNTFQDYARSFNKGQIMRTIFLWCLLLVDTLQQRSC